MAQVTIYDRNFSSERAKINAISEAVGPNLAAIERIVSGMKTYWSDDKSDSFITSVTKSLADAKTAYQKMLNDVDSLYASIGPLFNIYKG